MAFPPPLPAPKRASSKRKRLTIILGAVVLAGVCGYLVIRLLVASGITRGPDQVFGDQHLKTSVALIELHKVRYGKYPATLGDLKFTGAWDQMALTSVQYTPAGDGLSYYVEVQRGWMGKPDLKVPANFWQGTGYSPGLKPPTP